MTEPAPAVGRADAAADPLAPYDAVLVLSYGGPAGPADVLPFMRNATAGRGVPDSRLLEVSGHYAGFDGVSPINARNAEMLEALRAELARRGSNVPVVIGNRNWHPFVTEAMRELADGGARRLLSLTTAAYASYSGCRQYREDTAAALVRLAAGTDGATGEGFEADAAARVGGAGGEPVQLVVDKTRPFYNTPGMLEANADAIADACAELTRAGVPLGGIRLVLVTHSIPVGMERGSAPHAGDGAPGDAGDAAGTAAGGPGSTGAGSGSAANAPTGDASDLMLQDLKAYKNIWNENRLFSFRVVRCSLTPGYLNTTHEKKAWGAAATTDDVPASLAYHEDSVGRCQGDFDMYSALKDPQHRGDIIGFNMRGMALPITGKYIGALLSAK